MPPAMRRESRPFHLVEILMALGTRIEARRIARWARWGFAVVTMTIGAQAGRVLAQADLQNIAQPIPVINPGGHSAPVRSLIYAPGGSQLLSAGFDKIVNIWTLRDEPPELARTIRPRIWRGPAGSIYAMALSPQTGSDGQRILAV